MIYLVFWNYIINFKIMDFGQSILKYVPNDIDINNISDENFEATIQASLIESNHFN
jgi:hypothetical protein